MFTGKIIKNESGSLSVHFLQTDGLDSVEMPLDIDQWGIVKEKGLIGKEVYTKTILQGGCFVAHIIKCHSDSNSSMSKEDAEEFARQAFYEGREVSRMEGKIPIFKHQTFNGWLRDKHNQEKKDLKGNSKA